MSERGAGDCHVYPRKEEKDRLLEKDREEEKERGKEEEKEVEKVDREQAVESAPLPAIEIEIPCDEMMKECIFVPIPIPLPIPIHPHAGDPLLVEDPGTAAELSMLLQFLLVFLPLRLVIYSYYNTSSYSASPVCARYYLLTHSSLSNRHKHAVNVMNNVTKNCYKAPAVQKSFFEVTASAC